jgi:glycosyltransferase involved in cell wall biosynthesis
LADEWGLVVNEAMASGLPVLGSLYSQAVQELVEDGVTGWTFHPDRADEMYTAVDRALSTGEDRLEEMRVSATTRVEYLTPDYLAERILEAIHFVRPDLEI